MMLYYLILIDIQGSFECQTKDILCIKLAAHCLHYGSLRRLIKHQTAGIVTKSQLISKPILFFLFMIHFLKFNATIIPQTDYEFD